MTALLSALAAHCLDGSEIHQVVDRELRGLENEEAATKIKDAVEKQYRDVIPVNVVIELVNKVVELTWGPDDR